LHAVAVPTTDTAKIAPFPLGPHAG
jgi:hypothetical protein